MTHLDEHAHVSLSRAAALPNHHETLTPVPSPTILSRLIQTSNSQRVEVHVIFKTLLHIFL